MKNIFLVMAAVESMTKPIKYEDNISSKSIEWYKKLNLFQRISLKEMSQIICGIKFEYLTHLFGFRGYY